MDPQLRDTLASEDMAWMSDAKVCRVGEYQVIGPASGENQSILVLSGKQAVFTRVSASAMMFKDGLPLAVLSEGESAASASLSYDVRDESRGLFITVLDRDLDGQPDMRIRHAKGQHMEVEIWQDNAWQTMIFRDGNSGYMRDGQFVPFALGGPLAEEVEAK